MEQWNGGTGTWGRYLFEMISKKNISLHADFHKAAADVLELALAGKKEEAHAALARGSHFALLSSKLTTPMMEWKRSMVS
jgi:hypothetical protein